MTRSTETMRLVLPGALREWAAKAQRELYALQMLLGQGFTPSRKAKE